VDGWRHRVLLDARGVCGGCRPGYRDRGDLLASSGQIFNVGEPDTLTELEWAERIAGAMEWKGEFIVRPDDLVPPPSA
jgi:hypothetical protein